MLVILLVLIVGVVVFYVLGSKKRKKQEKEEKYEEEAIMILKYRLSTLGGATCEGVEEILGASERKGGRESGAIMFPIQPY